MKLTCASETGSQSEVVEVGDDGDVGDEQGQNVRLLSEDLVDEMLLSAKEAAQRMRSEQKTGDANDEVGDELGGVSIEEIGEKAKKKRRKPKLVKRLPDNKTKQVTKLQLKKALANVTGEMYGVYETLTSQMNAYVVEQKAERQEMQRVCNEQISMMSEMFTKVMAVLEVKPTEKTGEERRSEITTKEAEDTDELVLNADPNELYEGKEEEEEEEEEDEITESRNKQRKGEGNVQEFVPNWTREDYKLLGDSDYKIWRNKILLEMQQHDLEFTIDPTKSKPEKFTFYNENQLEKLQIKVCSFIFSKLDEKYNRLVMSCKTGMEIMEMLDKHCDPKIEHAYFRACREFGSIKYKKGDETAMDFIFRFDSLLDIVESTERVSEETKLRNFLIAIEDVCPHIYSREVSSSTHGLTLKKLKSLIVEEE
jgi:hypothetical protein